MTDLRILFAANVYPLPEDDGTKMRVGMLLRTLRRFGSVDMLTLGDPDDDVDSLGVDRIAGIARSLAWQPLPSWRWFTSTKPSPWPMRNTTKARDLASEFTETPYDLVFYNRPETLLTFGDVDAHFKVMDFDALQSERIATRLETGQVQGSPQQMRAKLDVRRWQRVEKQSFADMDLGIVCNEDDRQILGDDSLLVPNGFADQEPLGRPETLSQPPLIGMVAAYGYGPNEDAARLAVEQVMPRVLQRVPDAQMVLVGKDGERLEDLKADRPWLTITGWVDSVEPWLEQIDVMLMPVRFGAGTRLKVLEALAHRIPVVATSYAVAGHGLVDGTHVRVGETFDEMAGGVADLIDSSEERVRLADAGRAEFERSHTWGQISAGLESAIRTALG